MVALVVAVAVVIVVIPIVVVRRVLVGLHPPIAVMMLVVA
jgi:hypothetical protein